MGKGISKSVGAHEPHPISLSELIHRYVRIAIETAVHEELRGALGTSPYERRDVRRGYRNGVRERTLTGPTGPVVLMLPRATLFSGAGDVKEWTSTIVPRYQRRLPEVNEAVIATYLAGGNTRRIRGALQPLLKAAPLSKSAVSRVIATLKDGLEAWRTRALADLDVIYVYLDGFALRVRSAGKVVSVPALGVVGVLPDGHKQLLALELRGGESLSAWKGCLDDLVARGLRAPRLAIIDGNAGLRRAVDLVWPRAAVQRCCVHKLRNLERKAPKHALAQIRDDFHRIVYATNADVARTAYAAFERTWSKRCLGVVTSLREGGDELFTFLAFPKAQWKTLRTTNTIERLPRGIPTAREDTRLAAERGRRRGPALQPRRQWADHVAPDRWPAENRHRAEPAYGGSSVMIRRAALAAALALAVLAAPLAAEAQQAAKIARIGYLAPNLAADPHRSEAFRQGLRDLGYIEGRNVVIEYRDAEGKYERLPALAAELVALKVDVILAPNTVTALAAKQATKTIPIVFAGTTDPVASGLVASLARPGGNVTGGSNLNSELLGKCLELLKQAVPGVSRVAVLWQAGAVDEHTEKDRLKRAEVAARALGMRLQFVEARGPEDFDRVFSEMTRARAGALTVLGSTLFIIERRRLVDLVTKNRLPAVYPWREFVDVGGLMAYGANSPDLYRRAATYVDRILKGTKPGDLPVEQPTKFELVINLKAAKALGLTIPPSVLTRADQVIDQ